mmetsp:Transcript_68218/g.101365  ORF Transcript_68218/g.101365 Transcript_68218/m.101365 type:complete len:196 (+) Transcript_68218:694-1281(+)
MHAPSAEPNIVDFMGAVGETTSNMSIDNARQYTNRNVLRLSAQWANTVTTQRRSSLYRYKFDNFDEEIDEVISTLTPECALLEVNAIALLSSLEVSNKRSCATKVQYELHYEDDSDDDGMSTELTSLEESTHILQLELEAVRRKISNQSIQLPHNEMSSNEGNRQQVERSLGLLDLAKMGGNKISFPRFLQLTYS